MMVQNNQLSTLLTKIAHEEGVSDFLFVLHGTFDQNLVLSSVKLIEDKCLELKFSSSLITRLKIISVEILQNIAKHQYHSSDVLPYFVIGSGEQGITIYSGNIVNKSSKNLISDRLNVYSSFDADQLKAFYRDSLKNTHVNTSGNAGLGLLDIVYRAKQKVEFSFQESGANLFHFGLNVNVANQHGN